MKNLILVILILFPISETINAESRCSEELSLKMSLLPSWMTVSREDSKLDQSCIQHSMNIFKSWAQSFDFAADDGYFLYCSDSNQELRKNIPQCQTPLYLNTIGNSFDLVVDCLDLEPEDLYPIISTESGFYHNAFSRKGTDIGFGQITDPAILDVTHAWYPELDLIKSNPKKSCQKIATFVEEFNILPVENDYHCNLTKVPVNPLLNAVYTGLHYKIIKGYMEQYFQSTDILSRLQQVMGNQFNKERESKIKRILTILSYNIGHNALREAFEEFLLSIEFELEKIREQMRSVSTEMAQLRFSLAKGPSNPQALHEQLNRKKQEKAELLKLENELQNPKYFSANLDEGTFGSFLVKRKISYYLRALYNRMQSISQKDRFKLCPTQDFVQVH
jgi:hypothetical protein